MHAWGFEVDQEVQIDGETVGIAVNDLLPVGGLAYRTRSPSKVYVTK